NLREVAAQAGVNRGLVYHYFGSRQRLLRAALRRRGAAFQAELGSKLSLPFRARMARLLETSVRHSSTIALNTILMLDRDDRLRTMPLWRQNRELLDLDIAEGRLSPDIDPVGVHTAAVTAVYGYVLYREAFARELGIPVTELDLKVSRVFDRMLDGVAVPPPPAEPIPPRRGLRFGR
ncbi:MAG: TetR family transcriptional regulator, partial [Acidimicrobiales bacterium]